MTYAAKVRIDGGATTAESVPLSGIPAAWDSAWDDLAQTATEPNPFYERWFLKPAITHLKPLPDARMIAVWHDDTLVGLLPLSTAHRYGRLPIPHIENWLHYHCFYGAPLIRTGQEAVFWDAALALLDDAAWAPNFLHLVGLDPAGAAFQALKRIRRSDVVHRSERALLSSPMTPQAYYETHVRQKKRKEIRRLRSRLEELGAVAVEYLEAGESAAPWIAEFLALEASGWKGREGSALDGTPETRNFFEESITGAHAAGRLEMVKLTLDGKAIAMLANFMTPPGSFAFKIAFDEDYARFSPGVLIKIENLRTLDRKDIAWTDSCAVEDHPMINSLWAERREIVRVTVPLAGAKRKAVFHAARAAETLAATLKGRR